MIEISPFRGVRYAQERADAGALIAPPYDVIDADGHRGLLAASPRNVARITLGGSPGEPDTDYQDRARALRSWLDEGFLVRDREPGYYVYRIRYATPEEDGGREFRALVGRVRLDGAIRAHENTFPRVVDDRLGLLRATGMNLGQVMLLYSGPDRQFDAALERTVAEGEPLLSVSWRGEEEHALYRLEAPDCIRDVEEALGPATLTIADGHHRFKTAQHYARELEGSDAPADLREAAQWRMVAITDLRRGGISLLPTHRTVRLGKPGALAAEEERFRSTFPLADGGSGAPREGEIVLYTRGEPGGKRVAIPEGLRAGRTGAEKTTVAILHREFLGASGAAIEYPRRRCDGLRALEAGQADLFLELPAVSIETFLNVLESGDLFPHKTTCFHPKLFTGLIMRDLLA